MVINTMEKIVDMRIEEQLKEPTLECCKCEQCVENIKCLALNKLKPKYVSTTKGELFSKIEQVMQGQNKLDIDVAVIGAIDFVSSHPLHEKRA